jgi:hypothetical protein
VIVVLAGIDAMMIGLEGVIEIRTRIAADGTARNAENPHRLGSENRRRTSQT